MNHRLDGGRLMERAEPYTAAARQVAAITARKSIPACESTPGCTKMMYDMARKVVVPPMTSRWKVVPWA